MAYDYSRFQAFASRLIAKYGQVVTLTRRTPGTYDPTTAVITGASFVDVSVHAVFKRPKQQNLGASRTEPNSLIDLGDWDVALSAEECGQRPNPGDTILRDGVLLTVAFADEVRPANAGIVYLCRLAT